MKYFGLRTKLTIMIVGVLVIAIFAAALMIRQYFYDQVITQKMTTAEILTAAVVHDIKYDKEAGRNYIVPIMRKYITYYRIISTLSYYDTDLVNTADANSASIGSVTEDAAIRAAVKKAKPSLEILAVDEEHLVIRSVAPVLRGTKILGAVVMDLSIKDLEIILKTIDQRIWSILLITAVGAAIVLFMMLRSTILARVSRLTDMTNEIAKGNYSIEISDNTQDELGELARAFDKMTLDLKRSKEELDIYHSKRLEKKVHDATARLTQAYKELQHAQSQIVLNEKMASLGVLIAGIAHEINTPIGAINNVSRSLKAQITNLPDIIHSLPDRSDTSFAEIKSFLDEVIERAGRLNQLPSFQSTRNAERLLRQNGVPKVRHIANTLASFNLLSEDVIQRYLSCFREPRVIELARCVGNITQGAAIAASSCTKIEEIIKALKYYAYTDKGKVEMTDINESVNTALVLLRNKLKYSIELATNWGENIPPVSCTSEIHQVWTNLLSNACDAVMEKGKEHKGRVSISTQNNSDWVIVEIADNGGGIPESLMGKIFDPFFTTKGIGKGTGLGLSIVSGIVKKHHGTINVDCRGGITRFKISLPMSGVTESELTTDKDESKVTQQAEQAALNTAIGVS
jgi:signal transduction histidine kinase